ncbi:MAG: hypothetical protein A3F72_07505 [Bacteroidetes bacterium RIFCSPLOWO2_12_FULL_35_15]|nr:MAG: hypothetical protein A3F72_07505 [Bacteroidetes bacterium RIFCSPLOWO2_12_FULL_35_15]
MKTTLFLGIAAMFVLFTTPAKSQNETSAELKIKTSAICDMCKETLENALAFEKGIKKSNLDVTSKVITVVYNPKKTTPENIRLAISKAGYDADDIKANPKAYKKLEDCCKKDSKCDEKK